MRTLLGFSLILICLAVCAWISAGTSLDIDPPTASANPDAINDTAAVSVFGEFRTSLSAYMWTKIEEYVHGGVALRRMTPKEQDQNNVRHASVGDHEEKGTHDEHNETTVIPDRSRDWRGVFGNIERDVKPFFDVRNHKHNDVRQALPLFRFSTWADPRFVAGYVVGAEVISRTPGQIPRAIAYLQEGRKNNPGSIEILTELGRYYAYYVREYDKALGYLQRAVQLGKPDKFRTEDEIDALANAYRWRVLAYRLKGDKQNERLAADEGVQRFPNDPVLLRMRAKFPP